MLRAKPYRSLSEVRIARKSENLEQFCGSSPFFFNADTVWTPKKAIVDGTPTFFVNIDGIIFYTDDRRVRQEVAVATLATVGVIAKNAARKVGTRLGADAVLSAAVRRGFLAVRAANSARMSFSTFGVGLGFGLL